MSAILMTVDVEEWFQVENLRPVFPPHTWEGCESRVEGSTRLLLDLFDEYHVVATFFVLGWVAERHPGLVREIHARGHEVASHGYGHRLCGGLSRDALRDDLARSKKLLEDFTGEEVVGYRAPSFTVTRELIACLAEGGYLYDSSYNDFSCHGRYGRLEGSWESSEDGCLIADNGLVEIPVSNLHYGPLTVPLGGGGYFRAYPAFFFVEAMRFLLSRKGLFTFYMHPWEVDPGQPRVKGLRAAGRVRHYLALDKTAGKLRYVLRKSKGNKLTSCKEYINARRVRKAGAIPLDGERDKKRVAFDCNSR